MSFVIRLAILRLEAYSYVFEQLNIVHKKNIVFDMFVC